MGQPAAPRLWAAAAVVSWWAGLRAEQLEPTAATTTTAATATATAAHGVEHWDEPVERTAAAKQLEQPQTGGRDVSSSAPAPPSVSASWQGGGEERGWRWWREEWSGDAARGLPADPGVRPAVSELEQQLGDVA